MSKGESELTKILTRAYVHEQLRGFLSITDPDAFVDDFVATVRELLSDSRYEGRPSSLMEALSEDVSSALNGDNVSACQAYAVAQALYSPSGIFSGQPFGVGTIYAKSAIYTTALCLDAAQINVCKTLLNEAKRFYVLEAIKGRNVWKKVSSDMSSLKDRFGIHALNDYVSELVAVAQNYLRPLDAKEFPESGCKEFLESRGMSPIGVLSKFSLGIESSTQALTTFRRLIRVIDSLSRDLNASGAMSDSELTESLERTMAGVLHMRASKTGDGWRAEDEGTMRGLLGHVHEELPLKSVMALARTVSLSETSLAGVDLTKIHGLRNVKSAVARYVDPSEALNVIANAGITGLFSANELRRFRGSKLEVDLGM